ncbi:hypothetical protein R5W24_006544 [Gemmata sp. JC717]|uniref:hypothetical protein n=1 Tax=Gemmata algarum TaxID=2975278 RepID=UPI0021BB6FB3|nr:hypothetical protein [Gemmata algarum]MDY3557355.1 hypothetical protein [Gemmata algarum]
MTEAEWLACEDPDRLLEFLKGRASQRKLRLFFVSCCERVERFFVDARSRTALACARRYADGLANVRELDEACSEAKGAWEIAVQKAGFARPRPGWIGAIIAPDPATSAAQAVQRAAERVLDTVHASASDAAARAAELEGGPEAGASEQAAQCALARDIFRTSFRPIPFVQTWRTDTALLLAKQMYGTREFSAMPILADALQDAGCDNEDILGHCRGLGPHVRGCWVVDLVLGKE